MNKLIVEEANKLSTVRLLTYYKKYGHSWIGKYYCGCCGEFLCSGGYCSEKDYKKEKAYWDSIKDILNNREHITNNLKQQKHV